jgi:DNA repair photolyase
MAIRFKRKTPGNWKSEVTIPNKVSVAQKKYNGRIMIPSSHDITPKNINLAIEIIQSLLSAGNNLLIVSKPHAECIEKLIPITKGYSKAVTFRFSIGSCHDDVLRFWEPSAPAFDERLACLKMCYNANLNTSVSAEPILDTDTRQLINIVSPYVNDAIWIGTPNHLLRRLKVNGCNSIINIKHAKVLTQELNDEYIFGLVNEFRENPKIKWKESIKKIAGIEYAINAGEDV